MAQSHWASFPLGKDVAEFVRPWIIGMQANSLLWPGKWAEYKQAGQFLKKDLAAARAKWIETAVSDSERCDRKNSDFLRYSAETGRADFHALRHTFLLRLSRAGASPKVMQEMARHSTVTMTLERYTHADIGDLSKAVQKLPSLPTTVTGSSQSESSIDPAIQTVVAGLVAGPSDIDWQLITSVESTHPFVLASL